MGDFVDVGGIMRPVTEKVLQRLAHERLIIVSSITPRRRRITFRELLAAATEEPRILAVLPAIAQNKPGVVRHLHRGLAAEPALRQWIEDLLDSARNPKDRNGITADECRRIAEIHRQYLRAQRGTHRDRLFNLRVSEEDWRILHELAERSGTRNVSALIRRLIHERHAALTPKSLHKASLSPAV